MGKTHTFIARKAKIFGTFSHTIIHWQEWKGEREMDKHRERRSYNKTERKKRERRISLDPLPAPSITSHTNKWWSVISFWREWGPMRLISRLVEGLWGHRRSKSFGVLSQDFLVSKGFSASSFCFCRWRMKGTMVLPMTRYHHRSDGHAWKCQKYFHPA